MKRIAYADAVIGTGDEVARLVLEYAGALAEIGSADTVVIPAQGLAGGLQQVSLLLGPASQISVLEDDRPFEGDTAAAEQELRDRIAALSAGIPQTDDPVLKGIEVPDEPAWPDPDEFVSGR